MGVSPHFYHHDPVVAVQLGCVEDDVRADGEGKVLAYDESHDGDAWQAKVKKNNSLYPWTQDTFQLGRRVGPA